MQAMIESIALRAGAELMARFRGSLQTSLKSDDSLVTEADLASQKLILTELSRHFPNDRILSEEDPHLLSSLDSLGDAGLWIVDPLDGTTNFANGFDYFCVSIARATFVQGVWKPHAAVVYAPVSKVMYSAERGKGAFRNGVQLRAFAERRPKDFAQCFLATGFAYDKGEALRQCIDRFSKVADRCQSIRRPGAAALDLCLVAEGVFDGFWEQGLKIWDVAGALTLLQELGACTKNFNGLDYQLPQHQLVAGRAEVVDTILNLF